MKILDGKKLSLLVALKLEKKITKFKTRPKLVIIQIGDLAESNTYIRNKKAFAEKIGVSTEHKRYPDNVSESRVIADIKKYNKNKSVHGIMMQLPGPKNFDTEKVLETIDPKKDVDGLTALNTKHLFDNSEAFVPATARGIIALLDKYKVNLKGATVTIVGHSSLVGKPAMLALLNRGATVTMCHKDTRELAKETRRSHILISAVGKPGLITKKHVAKGQVVIDIGITVLPNGKVAGDVDFKNVSKIVGAISPVPGGVGPMTVATLFENLLDAYELQRY